MRPGAAQPQLNYGFSPRRRPPAPASAAGKRNWAGKGNRAGKRKGCGRALCYCRRSFWSGEARGMASRGRVVVLHFAGQMPLAGIAWQALHYLARPRAAGLRGLVCRGSRRQSLRSPRSTASSWIARYNVAYLEALMERFGLGGRWAYWDAINDVYHGLSRERVAALFKEADALINLCGATRLRDEHMACPVPHHGRHRSGLRADQIRRGRSPTRAPISTPTRISSPMARMSAARAGSCRCAAFPGSRRGRRWCSSCGRPTATGGRDCFSTIATWENKGKNIDFEGERYVWSKHVNFLRFLDLPQRRRQCFTDGDAAADARGRARRSKARAGAWSIRAPISADDRRLWRFHPRLARRVHRRQGHLCAAQQRLVQRPQRLLSRLGPAGGDHATRALAASIRWAKACSSYADERGSARRDRRDQRRLPAPQPRRAGPGGGIFRRRPRCWRRCWTGCRAYERSARICARDGARAALTPLARHARLSWDELALALFCRRRWCWSSPPSPITASPGTRTCTTGTASSSSIITSPASHDLSQPALPRSVQLRRRLRHDRGGAEPVLAVRHLRDAASAQRARRPPRHRRHLEARPRAGRAARRLLRRALPRCSRPITTARCSTTRRTSPSRSAWSGRSITSCGCCPELPRPRLAAGREARHRDRPGARRARRRAADAVGYVGLVLLLFALWRGVARRGASALLVAMGWTCLWRVLRAGGGRGLSGDAAVLAVGAASADRQSARGARVLSRTRSSPSARCSPAHYVPATDLPWEYLPAYILLALPELVLLLLVGGAGAWPLSALRARRRRSGATRVLGRFMLGFAIVFPVAYAVAIKAVLFDGMRHFIFVLPPIAGARGARRRPRARPARRLPVAARRLWRAGALRPGAMSAIMAHAASRRIRLLQRLHRRRRRRAGAVQARLLGQFLRRGGARRSRTICAPNTAPISWTTISPSRSAARRSRPRIISRPISSSRPNRDKAEFFIAFTKDDCDKIAARQGDLSRRAHGHAAVGGARPPRHPGAGRGPRRSPAREPSGRRPAVERGEYERLAAVEERMWWFRGLHANLHRRAWRHAAGAPRRLLDAGCGTGGLAGAAGARRCAGSTLSASSSTRAPPRWRAPRAASAIASASIDRAALCRRALRRGLQRRRAVPSRRRRARGAGGVPPLPPAGRSAGAQPAGLSLALLRRMTRAVDNVAPLSTAREVRGAARRRPASRASAARYWNSLLFPLMVLRRKLGAARAARARSRCCRRRSSALFGAVVGARARLVAARLASALRRLDPRDGGEAMTSLARPQHRHPGL